MALMALFAVGGLMLAWFALALRPEEKAWMGGLFNRDGERPASRRAALVEERDSRETPAAPPRSRPAVAVAEPARPVAPAVDAQGGLKQKSAAASEPWHWVDDYPALARPAHPAASARQDAGRPRRPPNATPGCWKAYSRISMSVATSSRSGPGPSSPCMNWSRPAHQGEPRDAAGRRIARNMSALSARVATIPGRSVIGIELPNPKREAVSLSELVGSQAYEDQNMALPLILGRTFPATRSSPTWRRCRICWSPARPDRANPSASTA